MSSKQPMNQSRPTMTWSLKEAEAFFNVEQGRHRQVVIHSHHRHEPRDAKSKSCSSNFKPSPGNTYMHHRLRIEPYAAPKTNISTSCRQTKGIVRGYMLSRVNKQCMLQNALHVCHYSPNVSKQCPFYQIAAWSASNLVNSLPASSRSFFAFIRM